jgi:23S rRNA pseudouridine2605 synthase
MVTARNARKGDPSSGSRKASAIGPKKTARKLIKSKKQPRDIPKEKHEDDLIRLNKYLASTGICSRREADEFIQAGLVTVNGKLVTELGTRICADDVIKYNGERLKEEKKVYILLNKPKDYITTLEDPHAKKTVLDLIKGACRERVYPVGRLDRNTTGVLLLTNDGELTKKLTHPRFEKRKVYHVELNKGLRPNDMEKVATGIMLEDGFIKADAINYTDPEDKKQIGIEIHSGRNRIVRRIFEQLDYEIRKLDRVYFAGLSKKGLSRGQWRFLTEREVSMLKMNAFK